MLTVRTLFSASWTVLSRLIGRVIDFATLFLLARVLTPADFGVTALAVSLVLIVDTVLEVPLIQALARMQHVGREDLDTAFTVGLLRGVTLFLIVAVAAWPLALLYGDPNLSSLAMTLAVGAVARSLLSPGMVTFIRDLRFQWFFVMEVSGKIGGALAAIVALHLGAGYWTIAVNSIVSPILASTLSYGLAPYRPRFSLANWREMRDLVGWLTFAQMISAVNWQFDRFLLGKLVPSQSLGYYTMTSDVATLPTQTLIGPAMSPLMAGFGKLTDDRQRLRTAFLRAARLAMLISVPACIGLALTADLVVATLLGPQWLPATPYLRWSAVTIIPQAYSQVLFALILVLHRTRTIFNFNATDLAIRVVLIPSLGFLFLIPGVIAARGVIAVVMFALALLAVRRFIGIGVRNQLVNLWKVALSCAVMIPVVLIVRHVTDPLGLPAIVELGMAAGSGALVYVSCAFALGVRLHKPDVRLQS